jgi:hypothetical protein
MCIPVVLMLGSCFGQNDPRVHGHVCTVVLGAGDWLHRGHTCDHHVRGSHHRFVSISGRNYHRDAKCQGTTPSLLPMPIPLRTPLRFRTSSAIPKSELPQKRSELLGTRHQGTGVSGPISLESTERWLWLRSRAYIVQAH